MATIMAACVDFYQLNTIFSIGLAQPAVSRAGGFSRQCCSIPVFLLYPFCIYGTETTCPYLEKLSHHPPPSPGGSVIKPSDNCPLAPPTAKSSAVWATIKLSWYRRILACFRLRTGFDGM